MANAMGGAKPIGRDDDPHQEISRQLRALYDSVRDEGIPDRFVDLLEKLDTAEQAQAKGAEKR